MKINVISWKHFFKIFYTFLENTEEIFPVYLSSETLTINSMDVVISTWGKNASFLGSINRCHRIVLAFVVQLLLQHFQNSTSLLDIKSSSYKILDRQKLMRYIVYLRYKRQDHPVSLLHNVLQQSWWSCSDNGSVYFPSDVAMEECFDKQF